MTEKIFIFNGRSAGVNSTKDLVTLFTSYGIYKSADVMCCDFKNNFDGLTATQTTIIIPGGAASYMGYEIAAEQSKIANLFEGGCNGVFVCAGAYLATHNADFFSNKYRLDDSTNHFVLPTFWESTGEKNLALKLVDDYQALGPFFPTDAYLSCDQTVLKRMRKPYCVKLYFNENKQHATQLFAGGCGFEQLTPDTKCEVVATYADRDRYTFFYDQSKQKTIQNMPAMIRRKARDKTGGIFLSGPHIETCVVDSALLKLFQDGDNLTAPLPQDNYQPESAREIMLPLLRETLRRV